MTLPSGDLNTTTLELIPNALQFDLPGQIFAAYRKTSNISRTLVGNKIIDNSDVVGASPVGAAPTTSSIPT